MRYADSLLSAGEVIVLRSRQHWLALLIEARNALGFWLVALVGLVVYVALGSQLGGPARNALSLVILICLLIGLALFLLHAWSWWAQDYLITNRRILKVEGVFNKRSGDSSLEKINDAVLEQSIPGRILGYGDLDILTAADAAVDRYRMLARAPQFKKTMLDQKYQLEREFSGNALPSPPLRTRRAHESAGAAGAADWAPDAPAESETVYTTAAAPVTSAPPPVPAAVVPPPPAVEPTEPVLSGHRAPTADPHEITQLLARLADLRDRGALSPAEYEAKKTELLDRL